MTICTNFLNKVAHASKATAVMRVYCLACEAEARHMYCFSGVVVVVVVVVGGGVNFLCLGHFLGNYKG